jgi:PPOX class probable F420-dependent enzyme
MRLAADEARRRFALEPVARLATIRTDGRPHLVPIVFALDGETIYSAIDAKPKASNELARLRHIEANPAVSVLVDVYDNDWTRLWWVRADGVATVVVDGPSREAAVRALRAKYDQYADPNVALGASIVVTVERWVGWAAGPAAAERGR